VFESIPVDVGVRVGVVVIGVDVGVRMGVGVCVRIVVGVGLSVGCDAHTVCVSLVRSKLEVLSVHVFDPSGLRCAETPVPVPVVYDRESCSCASGDVGGAVLSKSRTVSADVVLRLKLLLVKVRQVEGVSSYSGVEGI
jgi:hypothetical protein